MNAFTRRGACPALSSPMQTGDGLLVRLNPVAGGLSPKQLIGLCESASRHGNGIVEITARGSFQIRGLSPASAAALAREVDVLGIAARTGVPVETSPLAGLDPNEIADPRPLAEAIRTAIDAASLAPRLGPKVSVVVDGGGGWLDEMLADVRLTAVPDNGGIIWRLAVAVDARTVRMIGEYAPGDVADTVLAVLNSVADLGVEGRARYLSTADLHRLLSMLPPSVMPDISPTRGEIGSLGDSASQSTSDVGESIDDGLISPRVGEMSGRTEGAEVERQAIQNLSDGRTALILALPFGSFEASRLAGFVTIAEHLGASEFRLGTRRTLVVLTANREQANTIGKTAEQAGLIVSPTDPRLHVAACAGAPACASGHLATRDIAATLATEVANMLDGSLDLHVSGCAKGCPHPTPSVLTIVGSEIGAGIVVDGMARSEPLAYTASDAVPSGLARIAALVRTERRLGEPSAACLKRIGAARIAMEFGRK